MEHRHFRLRSHSFLRPLLLSHQLSELLTRCLVGDRREHLGGIHASVVVLDLSVELLWKLGSPYMSANGGILYWLLLAKRHSTDVDLVVVHHFDDLDSTLVGVADLSELALVDQHVAVAVSLVDDGLAWVGGHVRSQLTASNDRQVIIPIRLGMERVLDIDQLRKLGAIPRFPSQHLRHVLV